MSKLDDVSISAVNLAWQETALRAVENPGLPVHCPSCHSLSISSGWNIKDIKSWEADVDLMCNSCTVSRSVCIILPHAAPVFFPDERFDRLEAVLKTKSASIVNYIQQHAQAMPAAIFSTHPLWAKAQWRTTTFHWHPNSEAPPIMGIVFGNGEAGEEIFREAERKLNHTDRFEEIRVSIIEGPVAGQENHPGYSVHISPDPESLEVNDISEDFMADLNLLPFMGQWNRHYPILGTPALLPKFKKEFAKHKEYLLAPVTRRADGQLYIEPTLGIIKNTINFRQLREIKPNDPDSAALILPQLIAPSLK